MQFVSCFFFKQKTAYEMRISDWSSDVCSSDLLPSRSWRGACRVSPSPSSTEGERESSRRVDPQIAQFAIQRRSPDPQPPRDFAHPAAIMADGQADDIGLDFFQRAQIAVGQKQGDADRLAVDRAPHVSV